MTPIADVFLNFRTLKNVVRQTSKNLNVERPFEIRTSLMADMFCISKFQRREWWAGFARKTKGNNNFK